VEGFRVRGWRRTASRAEATLDGEVAARAASPDGFASGPPGRVPADPGAAAFFDLDNTMMVGASIYHFARGLAARKFFTSRDLVRFGAQQVRFRVAGQEHEGSMVTARETALAFVAGRPVEEIVSYGEEIYDELMAGRIFSGTRSLAQMHLDTGQQVWLVTATPVELAQVVARRLGLTGALGTVAEVRDGVYTGRLVTAPLHGPAKAEAVRALAAREGLDLARCSAYSDSANDIPMLCLVGYPTAINPDPDLKAYAREHGWPVRDFRTGRKVAKVGIPAAGGTGLVAGVVVAGIAARRRSERRG
jgi:HAD superfamily hydrolase (TIGR01490 family)